MKKVLWITSIAALFIGGVSSAMADYATPYSDAYQTVSLLHMDTVRSSKYMEDDNSLVTGRSVSWIMSPNPTNGLEIVDPAVTAGLDYPAGNADFGTCYYLNGSNNIAIGNAGLTAAGLDIANLRMEFWAKSDAAAVDNKYMFERWGQIITYSLATGFRVRVWDTFAAFQDISATPAGFVATNWNHLAVEVNGEDVDIYVNGALETSVTIAGGLSTTTSKTTTYFGTRYNSEYPTRWAGYLDEFRIFNTGPFGDLVSYSDWCNSYALSGSETNLAADLELGVGDGLNNMEEWALGGNPYADDAAAIGPVYTADGSGLSFSYNRRHRADELGLSYVVETTDNLASGIWTNDGVSEAAQITGYTFSTVTNAVPVDAEEQKFLRLQISSGPQSVVLDPPDPSAYDLPLATVTPTIDGTISAGEYDDAYYIPLYWPAVTNVCGSRKYSDPTSDADYSVDYYLKWDATYLYVGIKVHDATIDFGTSGYPNDHVTLAIDPFLAAVVAGDCAFYNMYRTSGGTTEIENPAAFNQALNPVSAVKASAVQGDGYSIEVAYAWADLGVVSPGLGQKHGFAILCIDSDSGLPDFPIDPATDTFMFDSGKGDTTVINQPALYRKVTLTSGL